MQNPIIVFLDRTKADVPRDLVFPIGFSVNGAKLVGCANIRGQECRVIILDDSELAIPPCEHLNKDSTSLLLVVFHKTSVHHSPTQLGGQLSVWGKAMAWESFSHTARGDAIFDEIVTLIARPVDAAGFSARHGAEFIFANLDRLAANCQIGLLAEDDPVIWDRQRTLLKILPKGFRDEFGLANDWAAKIALIRRKSQELLA